jgi:hypothetical protein
VNSFVWTLEHGRRGVDDDDEFVQLDSNDQSIAGVSTGLLVSFALEEALREQKLAVENGGYRTQDDDVENCTLDLTSDSSGYVVRTC